MGPFPLDDNMFGIWIAIVILMRSLDPGKYSGHLQFSTAWHLRSAFGDVCHTSVRAGRMATMAKDLKKAYVTSCPTYGLWFDYFMHGVHKQMGKVVKPDLAMLIELLLALMEDLESDWICATRLDQCDEVASFGVLCW